MKLTKATCAIAIATVLAGSAFAQQSETAQNEQYTSIVRSEQSAYQLRASDLIGMNVHNYADDTIGEVDDLIISNDDNVVHAVISVGGFLGIGDKLAAVPYSDLQMSVEKDHLVYNATEEQLKALPEFKYLEGEMLGAQIREKKREIGMAMSNAKEKVKETAEDIKDNAIWDKIAGNWKQFKGQAKQQWGKLTDDELTVIEGQRDVLVGKIQESYGVSKEEAENQVDEWARTH